MAEALRMIPISQLANGRPKALSEPDVEFDGSNSIFV